MDILPPHARNGFSRRSFLAGAGTVAAASLASGCGDTTPLPIPAPSLGLSDIDILNFALNLEYLESEYYLRAATGAGLSSADAGGSSAGAVTVPSVAGPVASTNTLYTQFLNEFAQSELSHVRLLQQPLPAWVARLLPARRSTCRTPSSRWRRQRGSPTLPRSTRSPASATSW